MDLSKLTSEETQLLREALETAQDVYRDRPELLTPTEAGARVEVLQKVLDGIRPYQIRANLYRAEAYPLLADMAREIAEMVAHDTEDLLKRGYVDDVTTLLGMQDLSGDILVLQIRGPQRIKDEAQGKALVNIFYEWIQSRDDDSVACEKDQDWMDATGADEV